MKMLSFFRPEAYSELKKCFKEGYIKGKGCIPEKAHRKLLMFNLAAKQFHFFLIRLQRGDYDGAKIDEIMKFHLEMLYSLESF